MRLNLTALVTTLAIAQGTVGLPVVAQLDVNQIQSIAKINDEINDITNHDNNKNHNHNYIQKQHDGEIQHQQQLHKRALNAKTIDLIMSTLSFAVGVHSGLKFMEIYKHLWGTDHADSER